MCTCATHCPNSEHHERACCAATSCECECHARPCPHDLVEVLSTNGRNLDGAIRRCARCGERVAA